MKAANVIRIPGTPALTEQDETRSPTHKKVNDTTEPKQKLGLLLHGNRLEELQLDFIATQYFDDLYILDAVLGAGAFGVVLQIIERASGQELAMKVSPRLC